MSGRTPQIVVAATAGRQRLVATATALEKIRLAAKLLDEAAELLGERVTFGVEAAIARLVDAASEITKAEVLVATILARIP